LKQIKPRDYAIVCTLCVIAWAANSIDLILTLVCGQGRGLLWSHHAVHYRGPWLVIDTTSKAYTNARRKFLFLHNLYV